ncbi:MAG: glycosyltransferase [Planctomycetota bacterium]|jgi:UDP-N-acetylglucosamine transferase subunit ALG13
MIFLTVGTQFPFDRLVKAVDKAVESEKLNDEILAQIGNSPYRPRNFQAVSYMDKELFDEHVHNASGIISHAGMGNITVALSNNKPLLVMPRLRQFDEVVNDHQLAIAKKFERLGHLLAAYSEDDMPERIKALRHFVPTKRETHVEAVAERISSFLTEIEDWG